MACLKSQCLPFSGFFSLRMEDAGTSEEEDTDSQDSNVPTYHGHLARNNLIKTITPVVKAVVISHGNCPFDPEN